MNPVHRLRTLLRRANLDREMDDELRFHVEEQTRRNLATGMSPDEAALAARRQFGWKDRIREEAREANRWTWLEDLQRDIRHALRILRKQPGFTLAAMLTFAIGIGANTGAFFIVNALLLRSLPVHNPSELAIVSRAGPSAPDSWVREAFPFPTYVQFRERARSWDSLAAFRSATRLMVASSLGSNEGEQVQVCEVSDNFFAMLGVAASRGRVLTPASEDPTSQDGAAMLSHAFWQQRFAADPEVLGKTVLLNNAPLTIVGVAPAGFFGVEPGTSTDVWTLLKTSGRAAQDETTPALRVLGRLRRGASFSEAQAELDVIHQTRLAAITGASVEKANALAGTVEVRSGESGYNRPFVQFKSLVGIMGVVVALVLLVACANVASLLLARWSAREKELAVRSALGASRGRLIRQLLTESLVLAMSGGLLGLLFARWTTNLLNANLLPGVVIDLRADGHVLAFTVLVAIGCGALVGLLPALGFSRVIRTDATACKTPGARGDSGQRLNKIFVVAQIALSVCLVTGAGLFVRTLRNFEALDPGFGRRDVLGFRLLNTTYATNRDLNLARELVTSLETLPGAQSATWSFPAPLSGGSRAPFTIDGYMPGPGDDMHLSVSYVGPRFFETLGIPLLRGRGFEEREIFGADGKTGANVAVISDGLARKYFGDANPTGRFITLALPGASALRLEIVGIARDTSFQNLREKTLKLYTPCSSVAGPAAAFQIRTSGDAHAIEADVRAAIQRIDAKAFVADLRTMDEAASAQYAQERSIARISGVFSGIALALAAVGLYGLLALSVSRRTREIGIRMALGAQHNRVLSLVVRQGMTLVLFGCVIGIGSAMVLVRFVENRFFGVTAGDPANLIATTGLLLVVALLSCWLPARRAAKVDPMVALRAE